MTRLPAELPGEVRDLAQGGDAVVQTSLGVVFAMGGAIGERVTVRDLRREGSILRGRIVEIENRSPLRVEPPCKLSARCGGCPWMHLSIDAQQRTKLRFVSDAVGIRASLRQSRDGVGYRRRARLHFRVGAKTRVLGYHRWRSRELEDVGRCPILIAPLAGALDHVRSRVLPFLVGAGEVSLFIGAEGRPVAAFRTEDMQPSDVYDALDSLVAAHSFAGASLEVTGSGAPASWGDSREQTLAADGSALIGPPAGFSQANEEVNQELAMLVSDLAECADVDVLELYAGCGNLTVALAPRARSIVAVEQSAPAAEASRQNAKARGFAHVSVVCADAGSYDAKGTPSVVVLDPPRTGARDAIPRIVELGPERVVYVSCDTATLARDAHLLRQAGFIPDVAYALDMFPHTAHVEAAVRFRRATGEIDGR